MLIQIEYVDAPVFNHPVASRSLWSIKALIQQVPFFELSYDVKILTIVDTVLNVKKKVHAFGKFSIYVHVSTTKQSFSGSL